MGDQYHFLCSDELLEKERPFGKKQNAPLFLFHVTFIAKAVNLFTQSMENDNGLPHHFLHSGHSFDFDKVQLIHQERNWVKRKILEALYIQATPNTCNLNSGMIENWLTFFQFFWSLPFS